MNVWRRSWAAYSGGRQGIVLVSVLWTVVLLSALAMATSVSFRSFAGVIAIDRDRVRMDGLLTAGVEAGAHFMLKAGNRALPAGTRVTLPDGEVRASLSDEQGRIDINKAPKEVLASLFNAVDMPDAGDLAQAVAAWRDQHRPPQGANAAPVPNLPINNNPPAAPGQPPKPDQDKKIDPVFDDIQQLAQIPGMYPAYIDRLKSLVTVAGAETVNPLTAPEAVLLALPKMTQGRVDQLMALRQQPVPDPARISSILGPAAAYTQGDFKTIVRVELTAALNDSYAEAATAIILISPDDETQPYRLLSWTPHPIFAAP